ncbi:MULTISPECIES: hypothetical protein [unclassified Actinotignum]|uniref:hypothetical protein n=1 Tax=unclassified Actinotignum TaxID=2632702 RepID=UPI002A81BBF9|nr:hypothetical protein [Actinotignum sp. SLA_B059]MDY5127465.1 hypothetical protein [Actinotignum sp. SLA_B059]
MDNAEIMTAFTESLTMGELAQFESIAGAGLGDAGTAETLKGAAAVAAARLGFTLTAEETNSLATGDIMRMTRAAFNKPPAKPASIAALLATLPKDDAPESSPN